MFSELASRSTLLIYDWRQFEDFSYFLDELNKHHPQSREHSERVAGLCVKIGEALGLEPRLLRVLAGAGLGHDVGKIVVPLEVLNKPGRLDEAELMAVKVHPRVGAGLLAGILPPPGVYGVAAHHEHQKHPNGRLTYDRRQGSRDEYLERRVPNPEGEMVAQTIAVADSYDAFKSPRPYKDGMEVWEALQRTAEEYTGERKYYEALKRVVWRR